MFDESARLTRNKDVLSRVLDGEAVLLNLDSGAYFGLNDVGTRVWELLESPRTLAELRDTLLDEFEVTRETLETDLTELVGALRSRGLVVSNGA